MKRSKYSHLLSQIDDLSDLITKKIKIFSNKSTNEVLFIFEDQKREHRNIYDAILKLSDQIEELKKNIQKI